VSNPITQRRINSQVQSVYHFHREHCRNRRHHIGVASVAASTELSAQFPGGTLGPALAPPVSLPDGEKDLYITREKHRSQFAADVSEAQATLMFATQRPVTNC
jgi:hypothetical protein